MLAAATLDGSGLDTGEVVGEKINEGIFICFWGNRKTASHSVALTFTVKFWLPSGSDDTVFLPHPECGTAGLSELI